MLFIVSSNYTAVTFLDSNRRIYCIKDRSKNIYVYLERKGTYRSLFLSGSFSSSNFILFFSRTYSHKEEKIRFYFYINVMVACVNA